MNTPQTMITVIGRGHSGTRAMSHTLSQSGVYMGEPLNISGDLLPPEDMYEACRIIARYIPWRGGLEWDFGPVQTVEIPAAFKQLIERFLKTVLASSAPHRGWKNPGGCFAVCGISSSGPCRDLAGKALPWERRGRRRRGTRPSR